MNSSALNMGSRKDKSNSPTDTKILRAAHAIHKGIPELGRNEPFAKVKQDNRRNVYSKHIKRVLAQYGLDGEVEPSSLPSTKAPSSKPPQLPSDALAAQQKYMDENTRTFKLYGPGKYDFGVSPDSDQQIKIDIMRERLRKAGCPSPSNQSSKDSIGTVWPVQELYKFYWAVAQKINSAATKEDVGRQLEAEYEVNPLSYVKEPTPKEAERRRAACKVGSLKLKQEILKTGDGSRYVKVEARGNPVWDEASHEEFTLLVVKINRGNGMTAYGNV